MGTNVYGLMRYDGDSLRYYSKKNGLDFGRITAIVEDEQGKEIGTHEQPFLWHPWLYHYGRNWEIPDSGTYTLRVHVDAPEFGRHDSKNGKRYAKPVDITFEGVSIETGQKRTTPSG